MTRIQVNVEIGADEVMEAVEFMSANERAEVIATLLEQFGSEPTGATTLADEVVRLHDRVRYGGFDEGSAQDVLDKLFDLASAIA